ncbi:unnamed protein product [Spirodela intermedia]|uniref:Uncharacterized protein n=1 Tax=Spirodela intermedia TaxID=51605 RepID=A0A7I8JKJ1_SPIIN|nr:unnamed protein product [Spirodela intermedia]CAA6670295.1 unnamed protein product [Spirodela intermedia]
MKRVKLMNRESVEARKVVALWMWLESMGFPNMVRRAKNAPADVFQRLLLEAEAILDSLHQGNPKTSQNATAIFLTAYGARDPITLQFFYANRDLGIRSIVAILDSVGRIIFNDELVKASRESDAGRQLEPSLAEALQAPYIHMMEPTHEDYRSMLVTFHPGSNVTPEIIINYFVGRWGVSVERVDLDLDPKLGQWEGPMPTYGRVVFTSPSFLPLLLNGGHYAEFNIDGLFMWGGGT